MKRIIQWSIDHHWLVIGLSVLLFAAGAWTARQMPIDVFPDLTAPTVTILTEGHGMAPEEMESLVTFPIESAMNGASGVRRVRSATTVGISVVWVEFDWGTDIFMDGFQRFLGFQPNTKAAVLIFGLFHGFGLATKLQDFALSQNGLVANIVSFNIGVEIGQGLALTAILIGLEWWRTHAAFHRHAFAFNGLVMTGGFLLVGYQLSGYFLAMV